MPCISSMTPCQNMLLKLKFELKRVHVAHTLVVCAPAAVLSGMIICSGPWLVSRQRQGPPSPTRPAPSLCTPNQTLITTTRLDLTAGSGSMSTVQLTGLSVGAVVRPASVCLTRGTRGAATSAPAATRIMPTMTTTAAMVMAARMMVTVAATPTKATATAEGSVCAGHDRHAQTTSRHLGVDSDRTC